MKTRERKKSKLNKKFRKEKKIMSAVKANGGPCLNIDDVKKILAATPNQKQKTDALKNEIRYQKIVLGVKHSSLKLTGDFETLLTGLNTFLGINTPEISFDDTDDEDATIETEYEETEHDMGTTDTAAFGDFQFTV